MKFKYKVFLYFLLSCTFIIGIYGIVTYGMVRQDLEREMENRLSLLGKLAAEKINPKDILYIQYRGRLYEEYAEKLETLRGLIGANDVMIIGADQRIIFSLNGPEDKFFLKVDDYEIKKALSGTQSSSSFYRGARGKFFKTGYTPLYCGERVCGAVGIEASAMYAKYLENYRISFVYAGAVIFAIAMLLSLLISRGMTSSIIRLKKSAEKIAARDFSGEIEEAGEEELRVLAGTMEKMRRELKNYLTEKEKLATAGQFAAGIAHEIRNALSVVSGYAELIKEKPSGEKTGHYAGEIYKNAMKMSEFLNNFLAYTKDFTPDMKRHAVREIAEAAAAETAPEIREVISVKAGSGEITCDAYLLKRAIHNILINAFQAMDKKKGSIEIIAGGNTISVKDNGKGMSPETAGKIFLPFYTGRREGTGLGLAIAYRIVTEIHGGQIEVKSEEGKGSEFTIKIEA